MRYADYGLDAIKKSKDEDRKEKSWTCLWCSSEVNAGFGLCFSNWVICHRCVASAFHQENGSRWKLSDECFKCRKEGAYAFRNDSGWASDIYICSSCLLWAKEVLFPNSNKQIKMNELKPVALSDIDLIGNYREVEPIKPTDPDIIELADNIKKMGGVLQAVLLRPHVTRAGRYELIFGHRRYIASGVAGLTEIPANIKDVADEDVLELQITENLQRKDVHPLDEAIAFQSLIRDKHYSIEDIAARFGKKPEFVTHRLKLVDLIPELQKPFKKGLLSVGQAFVICRLRSEDQKTIRKDFTDVEFQGESIADLQSWINRNLLRQLSSASFKRDDATLDPKAGPCTSCSKRSGCGNLLFSDLKEDDRCFDAACFQRKAEAFFMRQLQDTIENKPKVHIIADEAGKLLAPIKKLLKDMNIPILEESKYSSYPTGKYRTQVKAFSLDGFRRGETRTIYVEASATAKGSNGKPAKRTVKVVEEEIAGINQRAERKLELDSKKVWEVIKEKLKDPEIFQNSNFGYKTTLQAERNAMAYALIKAMNGGYDDEAAFVAGIVKDRQVNFFFFDDSDEDIVKLDDWKVTEAQLIELLRLFTINKLKEGVSPAESEGPRILMPVLKLPTYGLQDDINALEAELAGEAAKRKERQEKRISALEEEKRELEEKKPAAGNKTTSSAKNSTSSDKKAAKGGKGGNSSLKKGIKSLLDQKPAEVAKAVKGPLEDDDPEDWK